jgi:phenylalanyl-tRNA synthetase beta chain
MLPSLLQNVSHNLNQSVDDLAHYEIGHTYEFETDEPAKREAKTMKPPAIERPYFAAVLCGGGKRSWAEATKEYDFFDIKGAAQYILNALGLQKLVVEPAVEVKWLHPGRSARFLVKGQPVAQFGEVHPALLKELDIKKRVFYLEIVLEGPVLEKDATPTYQELPRYPAIMRDIALVVDKSARSLDLERTIKKAGKELLATVKLFDVYEGQHVEQGKKSLAFSLTYRRPDRTLKEEEVTERHTQVLEALKKDHGAALRG